MTVRFRNWAFASVVLIGACTSGVQSAPGEAIDLGTPGSFYPSPHSNSNPPNSYGTPPAPGDPCNYWCSKAGTVCGVSTERIAECVVDCGDSYRLCPAQVKNLIACLFDHSVICQSPHPDAGDQQHPTQSQGQDVVNFPDACREQIYALVDCETYLGAGGTSGSGGSGGDGQGGVGGDMSTGGVGGDMSTGGVGGDIAFDASGGAAGATGCGVDCTGCPNACASCICANPNDPSVCATACTTDGG